jgi:hypothetical protein
LEPGGGKGSPTLPAFIALAAMPTGHGIYTGEGLTQGESAPPLHHFGLGQPSERPEYLDRASDCLVHDILVDGEELRGPIWKRV